MGGSREVREYRGWRFELTAGACDLPREVCDKLVEDAIASVSGSRRPPIRRSRHAVTHLVRAPASHQRGTIVAFVKVYDAPRGMSALKQLMRGSRAFRAAAATAALRADGFGSPRVLLLGQEPATGRTLILTERAVGVPLAGYLSQHDSPDLSGKRLILAALGAEVARLHRAGYIHGDLTPHNVFLANRNPPRFVFIDHDRTRDAFAVGRRRRQLRNLVQLLRFDLPGLTRADRMRVFRAWAEGLGLRRRSTVMRRGVKMLKLRLARDRRKAHLAQAHSAERGTHPPASMRRAGGAT